MKHFLKNTAFVCAIACASCAGPAAIQSRLADTDPANTPAVATMSLDSFTAQKTSFTLRVKNFKVENGQWVPGGNIGIVDIETAAIQHLQQAGYTYTPYPDKSRYNIEFHLTCYDPAGGVVQKSTGPVLMTEYPDDFSWGPYAIEEKTVVYTITPGETQQVGPARCSGKMLLLVRDRQGGGPGTVYAGHHNLPACPFEQGCAFSACLEPHRQEILKYLDIAFPK
jgi:hypothetical protein